MDIAYYADTEKHISLQKAIVLGLDLRGNIFVLGC